MQKREKSLVVISLLSLIMCSGMILAQESLNETVVAGESLEVPLGHVDDLPHESLSAIISNIDLTVRRFIEFAGIRIYEEVDNTPQVGNFTLLAFNQGADVNWSMLEGGSLLSQSENVEINGVTSQWYTYEANANNISGYQVQSEQGQALMVLPEGTYDIYGIIN